MNGDVAVPLLGVAGLRLDLSVAAGLLRTRGLPGDECLAGRIWRVVWVLLALGRAGVLLSCAPTAFAALREVATYATKAREDHAALALAFLAGLPLQVLFVGLASSPSSFLPTSSRFSGSPCRGPRSPTPLRAGGSTGAPSARTPGAERARAWA